MALTELNELQGANLLIHHKCDSALEEVQSLSWGAPNSTFAVNGTFGGTLRKATSTVEFQNSVTFETGAQFHALRNVPINKTTTVISFEESGGAGEVIAGALNAAGTALTFGSPVNYSSDGLVQSIDRVSDTRVIMSTRSTAAANTGQVRIFDVAGTALTLITESAVGPKVYKTGKTDIAMVSESGFVFATVSNSTSGAPPVGHLELFNGFIISSGAIEVDTFGPPIGIASGVALDRYALRLRKLDTDKFICMYEDSNIGKCRVGTVGVGGVITIGSEFRFANVASNVDVAVLDETHCVLLYRDDTEGDVIVRTATVAGTNLTFGGSGALGINGTHQSIKEIDRRRFLVTTSDGDATSDGNAILGYVREDNATIDLGTPVIYSSSATRNFNGSFDFNRSYVAHRTGGNGDSTVLMGLRLDNDSTPYGNNVNGNTTLAMASLVSWSAGSQGAIGVGYLNDSVDRSVAKLQTRNNSVFYNRNENDNLVVTLDYGSGIAEWFTSIPVVDNDQEYIVSHFEFTGGSWNLKVSKNGLSFLDQGTQSGTDFFGGSGEVIVGTTPGGGCTVDEVALWAGNTEFTDTDLDDLYQLILALESDAPPVEPSSPVIVGLNQRLAARIGVQTGSIGQNIVFGQTGVNAPGGFATVSPSGLGLGSA